MWYISYLTLRYLQRTENSGFLDQQFAILYLPILFVYFQMIGKTHVVMHQPSLVRIALR